MNLRRIQVAAGATTFKEGDVMVASGPFSARHRPFAESRLTTSALPKVQPTILLVGCTLNSAP